MRKMVDKMREEERRRLAEAEKYFLYFLISRAKVFNFYHS